MVTRGRPVGARKAMSAKDTEDAEARVPSSRTPPLSLGALSDILDFQLARARNRLRRHRLHYDQALTPGWFTCLALLAENPGAVQAEISRQLEIDKATVVANVKELEHRGLGVRQRLATDRRRHGLYVTDGGRKTLRKAQRAVLQAEMPIRARFTNDEWNGLLGLLARVYD
jgi:DNA-binding MarR family transcriptional regulator